MLRLQSLFAALIALFVIAISAAPASAGDYSAAFCTTSDRANIDGWWTNATAGGYFYRGRNCAPTAEGYYRRFETGTVAAGATDDWNYDAPDGVSIVKVDVGQTGFVRSPGAYQTWYAQLADGSWRTMASAVPGGEMHTDTYGLPRTGSRAIRLRSSLGCSAAQNCAGIYNGLYGNEWYLHGLTITYEDPSLPTFTSVSGAGWKASPADGVDAIDYSVADSGSGVKEVSMYVDGALYLTHAKSCTPGIAVPCALASTGTFLLDTTKLSEGPHTVALVAMDYSRNQTAQASKQLTIDVRRPPAANPTAPVGTTNPSNNGGGSPAVGDNLHGNPGSWSGTGNTYTYQWMRCDAAGQNCVPINGANGIDYSATSADVGKTLVFCVTATNSGGSTTSCSAPTAVVVASHTDSGSGSGSGAGSGSGSGTTASPASPGVSGTPVSPSGGQANGTGAAERVTLTAYTSNRSLVQKVKYGRKMPISGRLLGVNGEPIAGATLIVQTQTAVKGASMSEVAKVTTGNDGRFTYTAPAGPSRTIRFAYRSHTADASFADTTDVRLLVSAGITLKGKPKKVRNKRATTFTGRVLGRPLPKRGVVVDVQVFFRGKWRTIAAPRTNRKGAYKFKYRFVAGAATWRFRSRVRTDSGYPYETGLSRTIKVKVTR